MRCRLQQTLSKCRAVIRLGAGWECGSVGRVSCFICTQPWVWSPGMHKAGAGAHAGNSSPREVEAGGSEFKIVLSYIMGLGPAWNTWDPVSCKKGALYFAILVLITKMRPSGRVYLFLPVHMEKIRHRDSCKVRLSVRETQQRACGHVK